jgi:CHAT domain-containing protein/Tfp pilus assembly protein PilF
MIFEWNSQTAQQPGGIHSMIGDNFSRMGFLKKCSDGVMLMVLCLFMFQSSSIYADSDGDAMLSLALTRYHQGDSTKAISELTEASQIYASQGQTDKQIRAWIEIGRIHQLDGHHDQAAKVLELAMTSAQAAGDPRLEAWVSAYLGNLFTATGRLSEAHQLLEFSVTTAKELDDHALLSVALNHYGHYFMSQKDYPAALAAYQQSADESGDTPHAALSLTNAAMVSLRLENPAQTRTLLDWAGQRHLASPDSRDRAFGLISVGQGYLILWSQGKVDRNAVFPAAYRALKEAENTAERLKNTLALSYSRGYLGRLYEQDHRIGEALQLTRSALWNAQQTESTESLYLWLWQIGRLLAVQGDVDAAISAYRQAVDRLESIRSDITAQSGNPLATFRSSFGSLYMELVDLLLKRSETAADTASQQKLLSEARDRVEQFKVAELKDYFQDECVVAYRPHTTQLDIVSQSAVVIYPILLPDRIDMLISLPGRLKRIQLSVDHPTLAGEVRQFRTMLEKRITREYMRHAQRLYQWLIQPIEAELNAANVQTLVFVPDGILRTIPMAALHDGKKFLIQRYAVAVTPGLYLSNPQPMNLQKTKVLILGLSEATQGFPALPHVADEASEISTMIGGRTLLNNDFMLPGIQQSLTDDVYSIVHIASHSHFSGDKDHSYILTFDDRMTLEQMDQCLGVFRFRQTPLDLLTLSACETAVGDDRAALGLAGVAIKAGARSALASLWSINDKASSLLVAEFYRQLMNPALNRAQALQAAQMMLIKDPQYDHPVFWAPFLMINNWL